MEAKKKFKELREIAKKEFKNIQTENLIQIAKSPMTNSLSGTVTQ